jgi:glycosyltransferase involved in cell wall biosynthesis
MRRLLVVSHPAVLAVNQLPYAELRRYGWDPFIVAPALWRHEYRTTAFPPEVLPELSGRVVGRRVVFSGRVQRHVYMSRPGRLIDEVKPDLAFLEEEPTSAPAFQWSVPLVRRGIPFGMQADENLERLWPLPARLFRSWTLPRAAFVAARSPTAAALIRRVRPAVRAPLIPHHVPGWPQGELPQRGPFVVGFAGRLVRAKGLDTLIDAASGLDRVAVRLVGNGPLRDELSRRAASKSVELQIHTTVRHEDMPAAYAGFGVLVLPSRTTSTWAEQFGRVLVEALWCGVPVIGSDSGEIPWVINTTGGGLVFPEGDVQALARAIIRLRDSAELRRGLAHRGRLRVQELFSVAAVARAYDRALSEALARTLRPDTSRHTQTLRVPSRAARSLQDVRGLITTSPLSGAGAMVAWHSCAGDSDDERTAQSSQAPRSM